MALGLEGVHLAREGLELGKGEIAGTTQRRGRFGALAGGIECSRHEGWVHSGGQGRDEEHLKTCGVHTISPLRSRLRRLRITLIRHLFNVGGKLWISREHVVEGVFVERVEVTVVHSADAGSAGLAEVRRVPRRIGHP